MVLLLSIMAGLYCAVVLCFIVLQPRLLYFPIRGNEAVPSDCGLVYEDLTVVSPNGAKVHGWFMPKPGARFVILFCHGNGGNVSRYLDTMILFHDMGFSACVFDYQGYGLSEGKPGEQETYDDAQAVYDHLVKVLRIPPSQIVIAGRSLGGAIAAHLATRNTCHALIIESAFTSLKEIAQYHYPYLPVRQFTRYSYDTRSYLEGTDVPVLIVHSPDDATVPISHGRALFDAAQGEAEFLEIKGTHNEGYIVSGKQYREGIKTFIENAGK